MTSLACPPNNMGVWGAVIVISVTQIPPSPQEHQGDVIFWRNYFGLIQNHSVIPNWIQHHATKKTAMTTRSCKGEQIQFQGYWMSPIPVCLISLISGIPPKLNSWCPDFLNFWNTSNFRLRWCGRAGAANIGDFNIRGGGVEGKHNPKSSVNLKEYVFS